MVKLNWRKSSRSNANASECVEVAPVDGAQVEQDGRRAQDAP